MSNSSVTPVVGIIGGSGMHNIDGFTDMRWEKVDTPFGPPSDALCFASLDGQPVVFLPRHDRTQRFPPTEINARANIYALKAVGCTEVISIGAVGSLNDQFKPGTLVIVEQFVDRTFARPKSFFGSGLVAHVSIAHPVCARLNDRLEAASKAAGLPVKRGGTYLCMEGPQFSTHGESEMYQAWNCDVVGMTPMPELKLAREAELCYASVVMVTDYDCLHPEIGEVSANGVTAVLNANRDNSRRLVFDVLPLLGAERPTCHAGCAHALDNAIITAPEARDPEMVKKLTTIAGRVL
jgi:5'-methylthioadenosine phosphorylase